MLKTILIKLFDTVFLLLLLCGIFFFLYKLYKGGTNTTPHIVNKTISVTIPPLPKDSILYRIKPHVDTSTIKYESIKRKMYDTSQYPSIAKSLTPFTFSVKNKVSINYITIKPLEVDTNKITVDSVIYLPINTEVTLRDTTYIYEQSNDTCIYYVIVLLLGIFIGIKL